jgi:ORF6N domain
MIARVRPPSKIEKSIFLVRGHRVVLDVHIAGLYGVTTKALVQAVKRNFDRFPPDFIFKLINHEVAALRSQIVTSKTTGRGGRRYAPYAFTEQGVAMLSSVLKSPRAIAINIEIMRTFVRIREAISADRELAITFAELERKVATHDQAITDIFDAIRRLMESPPAVPARKIGFV